MLLLALFVMLRSSNGFDCNVDVVGFASKES